MPQFTYDQRAALVKALEWFPDWYKKTVVQPLEEEMGGAWQTPSEIALLLSKVQEINQRLKVRLTNERFFPLEEEFTPVLRRVLLLFRRKEAARIEGLRAKTHHLELLGLFDRSLETLDLLTGQAWFLEAQPQRVPQLIDYLPVQRVEQILAGQLRLPERKYDEKFRILQAPELFLPDLEFYREKGEIRETATAIAFVDIDNFKSFNNDYTETKVDRNLLPLFMRAIEAHLYLHGNAYRQGGDEYLILLPGFSEDFAIAFLDELRVKVAAISYPAIDRHTTISIGLCMADSDCFLTNRELQEMANKAKDYSKQQGRNRIAVYEGKTFRVEDLRVVRPPDADAGEGNNGQLRALAAVAS